MKTSLQLAAVAAMTAIGGFGLTPAAYAVPSADSPAIKDCGTTTVPDEPPPNPSAGMTQTETETQIAQCDSNSDTGEVITTGPVTNKGGGTPGGQQP
jgi:hypothetical protein